MTTTRCSIRKKRKRFSVLYVYEVPRTRKDSRGQKIIMWPNARGNYDGNKQSHDMSGSESIPMDTPDVLTVPTATNQLITALAIYRFDNTGAGKMTLKKMPGAPKNDTAVYVFYCNKKRSSVAQMYPDRSKSDISILETIDSQCCNQLICCGRNSQNIGCIHRNRFRSRHII